MTYFIETYGCQMNFAESSSVEQLLLGRGWTKALAADECSLLIINTCSVRITAETRVFGRLGLFSALKKKRQFSLVLMGCMAQRLHDQIKKDFPKIDYVVGMFEREQFSAIFAEIETHYFVRSGVDNQNRRGIVSADEFFSVFLNEVPEHSPFTVHRQAKLTKTAIASVRTFQPQSKKAHLAVSPLFSIKPATKSAARYTFADCSYTEGSFQSFVPIMNGCNNFCTYCIVPYVRGREISRPMNDILREISFLACKNVREITLLGQNVNSYKDIDSDYGTVTDFPALLKNIAARCTSDGSIRWIRFMSSHPKDMSDALIQTLAEEKRVCKSVHLPIQHGSNTILKRMNRSYTRESYLELVKKLRAAVKDIVITTDILIGFPGETEEDFRQTLEVMEYVQYDSAFMYHYNPREGTRAYHFPDRISDSVRLARLQQIIDLQMKITEKKMRKRLGSFVDVLIESNSRNNPDELFGHTEQGEMVVLTEKCDIKCIGHFVPVQLQSIKGRTFRAVPVQQGGATA